MIALRNAYHGGNSNRIRLTALNTWKYPIPQDPYCRIFGSNAALYAKDVQDHIDFGSSGEVAAIQGVGGAVELAPGYLKHVYDIVRKAGGVWIADEGIGKGLPLGAVVTTPEIASVMARKIQFNTFGGNPVCSTGWLAVLRVIDKEKRQAH
ncbi:hypothetical protein Pint_26754 [Pistacia integerrima]|uniref:Uncharacterized protein n=1 Tax=Pistacia integerrima TaxID=434235 RepID=A0ACC0YT64_9ROSI|nr:hypothetical protein Pint_26754 [Pistacia integerrima]